MQGNFIGTSAAGNAALGNGTLQNPLTGDYGNGIGLDGAFNNVIGGTSLDVGNLISGNAGNGIGIGRNPMEMMAGVPQFGPAVNDTVIGNYIGTDSSGTTAIGNGWQLTYDATGLGKFGDGIAIEGAFNITIGGNSDAGLGNLISGNVGNGIGLGADQGVAGFRLGWGVPSASDFVWGNRIGTTADGSGPLGNGWTQDPQGGFGNGIAIENGASNIQIGGPLGTGLGNLISGNAADGVSIEKNALFNRVQGNFIGTDAFGDYEIGNGAANPGNPGKGVGINGTTSNLIGGTSAQGLGNLISGNAGDGIGIENGGQNNQVFGNLIGTDVTGEFPVANGWQVNTQGNFGNGVGINGSNNNLIGGDSTLGLGNVISGNAGNGVGIENGSQKNFVLGNFIGTDALGTGSLGNGARQFPGRAWQRHRDQWLEQQRDRRRPRTHTGSGRLAPAQHGQPHFRQ